MLIGSPFGGMDIESVAHDSPASIFSEPIDITKGLLLLLATHTAFYLLFVRW